jgi:hypothetical protein
VPSAVRHGGSKMRRLVVHIIILGSFLAGCAPDFTSTSYATFYESLRQRIRALPDLPSIAVGSFVDDRQGVGFEQIGSRHTQKSNRSYEWRWTLPEDSRDPKSFAAASSSAQPTVAGLVTRAFVAGFQAKGFPVWESRPGNPGRGPGTGTSPSPDVPPELTVTGEILEFWAYTYDIFNLPKQDAGVTLKIRVRVREGRNRSLWDKVYSKLASVPREEVLSPLAHLVEEVVNDPGLLQSLAGPRRP